MRVKGTTDKVPPIDFHLPQIGLPFPLYPNFNCTIITRSDWAELSQTFMHFAAFMKQQCQRIKNAMFDVKESLHVDIIYDGKLHL